MITDPFCRYSCTYLNWIFMYNGFGFLYWCLAYIREDFSVLHIYITVTSPYLRDRGVTVSQVDNKLEIPAGSHLTPWREHLALPGSLIWPRWEDPGPSSHSTPRKGPRAFTFPDIHNYQTSFWHRFSADTPAFTGHNSTIEFPSSRRRLCCHDILMF